MGDLSTVAVLTVNYRSHHLLKRNLASLTTEAPELSAIVCDSYTTERERELVRDLAAEHGWTFLPTDVNGGFAVGTNLAARVALASGARLLLLLNPDAQIDVASVAALAAAVAEDPRTLAVPEVFDAMGRQKASVRLLRLADGTMAVPRSTSRIDSEPGHTPWLTGACLMVGADMWRNLDGLAEEYFMYWEDVEFSYRAARQGARLRIVSDARCVHDQGGTQRQAHESDHDSLKTPTFFYNSARNRLLFAARNLDARDQRAWLRSSPSAAWYLLRRARGRRRALLQSREAIWALTRGVRDGRRLLRPTTDKAAIEP